MYRAAVLTSPGGIKLEERKEPKLKQREVLVEVSFAGVCGTDLALFSGEYKVPLPLVLGHEFSGRVVDVGVGVSTELVGRQIVGEINNTCVAYGRNDLCAFCSRGLANHCEKRTVMGIISYDGAFSELIKIPVGNIHVLHPGILPEHGVFVEPLAAAIQTFELTPVAPGDVVVVLGAGRLGTLICAAASALGARVIAISRSKEKLRRARIFGATEVLDSSRKDSSERVKDITGGMGADVVVDATGSPEGLKLALNLVRPRGTLALKTTCGLSAGGIDVTKIAVDEIRIQGSRCGPFDKAINMLKKKEVPVTSLISDLYPLEEVEEGIRAAKTASKVLIYIK